MVTINVLKTKMCPHCPRATEIAEKVAKNIGNGVSVIETFLDTPDGNKIAMKYRVMTVPAIIIDGKLKFVGLPNETSLRKAVEVEMR